MKNNDYSFNDFSYCVVINKKKNTYHSDLKLSEIINVNIN